MRKGYLNFLIVLLLSIPIVGQSTDFDTDCEKIREGDFYFYPVGSQKGFSVTRKGTIQTEINLSTNDTSYWKANWRSDCAFELRFIRQNKELSALDIYLYSFHFVAVKVLSVTKDYYLFQGGFDSIINKIPIDTMWLKPR